MGFKHDYDKVDARFEHLLFLKLFIDIDFRTTVMPILKQQYFNEPCGEFPYDLIFKHFNKFYSEGQIEISPIQVLHSIEEERYLEPEDFKKIKRIIKKIFTLDDNNDFMYDVDSDYMIGKTEKFAQEFAIELALIESSNILENSPEDKGKIRELLDEALSIELNKDIGLDYLDTAYERFLFYQKRDDKIPFSLEILNKATYGGFARKTLNVFMAGTGIGKTLLMTSLTTDYIKQGYNVLYITLEISEQLIALRNDANLMEIPIRDFSRRENGEPVLKIDDLVKKFEKIKNDKHLGKLKIKEFYSSSTNTMQIENLIKEAEKKEGFKADVIIVDYLNLLESCRYSTKNSPGTYGMVKAIAEELRAIAQKFNVILISATQTNRDGISGDEVDLSKVSESAGLPATTDFFAGIFQTEDQREQQIAIVKILKTRYASNTHKKLALGVNYDFMRFYELDNVENDEDLEGDNSSEDNGFEDVFKKNNGRKRGR